MVRRPLNRRQFLNGSGGFTLALPFLESLSTPLAIAQSMAPVKRFVSIIAPNGYHEPVYYPTVAADIKFAENIFYKQLANISGPMSECLGTTFDPLRAKMNILRGLDIAGAFGHTPVAALASARRVIGGDSSPIDPPGNCRSLDVVLGLSKTFYPTAPKFKALRAMEPGATLYSIDKDAAGNTIQIPYTLWPYDMFQQVFGGSTPSTPTGVQTLNSKKALIGDLVLNDYKSLLTNPRLSAADRNIASNFVDQLQELNKKIIGTPTPAPVTCSTPNIAKQSVGYYSELSESEKETLTKQFVDIMMAAFSCDLTRVGIISLGNDNHRHDTSHEDYNNRTNNLHFVDIMKKYQNNIVKEFATRMNSVVESNGKTMLDNSLLFWGMEQSAGNAHCAVSMPAITFGGLSGAIKTGYYMDYRQRPSKYYASRSDIFPAFGSETYNQLMNTFFKGFGLAANEYEQYGDGGGFGTFDTNSEMQYLNGEYDSLKAKRKNTLPFISQV